MPKQHTIAVVMELHWPYKRHYDVFAGIQAYAKDRANWKLDLGRYPEIALAEGERLDGIIGRISKGCLAAARDAKIPVVNMKIDSPIASKVPGVHPDLHAVGRMTAEHLVARGLRRLAHVGYTGSISSKRQFEGMREVAREHGFSCTRHLVSSNYDDSRYQSTRFGESVKRFQTGWEAPIGVGFITDELCRSVASLCLSAGWVIPDQLAMVGTGNEPLICSAIDPTLSSVDMGHHQCGYEAAGLLDLLLRGRKPSGGIQHLPPKEPVVRRSSDVYAVSDPKVAQALRHMAEHTGGTLSVPEIAGSVGLGRQSLERRFRRHVGRTINDELIRLRVSKLKRLLVESEDPVKRLSPLAGFGTTVSMHTMFKRHTGMTPTDYRLKHGPRPERNELGT